jgi:hypothetical protein
MYVMIEKLVVLKPVPEPCDLYISNKRLKRFLKLRGRLIEAGRLLEEIRYDANIFSIKVTYLIAVHF